MSTPTQINHIYDDTWMTKLGEGLACDHDIQ